MNPITWNSGNACTVKKREAEGRKIVQGIISSPSFFSRFNVWSGWSISDISFEIFEKCYDERKKSNIVQFYNSISLLIRS